MLWRWYLHRSPVHVWLCKIELYNTSVGVEQKNAVSWMHVKSQNVKSQNRKKGNFATESE